MPLAPVPEVLFRTLQDGAVLVHLPGNQVYELNDTAAHVWTQLASGAAEQAIVASLLETFDVDAETASRQLGDLIRQFVEMGLLQA